MNSARRLAALVALSSLCVTGIASSAPNDEDDDAPDKGGRLSVSVAQVGPKVPVQQAVTVTSRLNWTGSKGATFSYLWTSVAGPGLPVGVSETAPVLDIPAGGLTAGSSYHLRLTVVATTERGTEITAARDVKFKANQPPEGGSCKVVAKASPSGTLQITLSAPGWKDPDGQPQYRFELRRGDKLLAVQNWKAFTSFATAARLKPGEELYGRCGIRDELGDGLWLETERFGSGGTS